MTRDRQQIETIKPKGRSRTTNGAQMLDGIDGRSTIARRLRDIVRGLLIEFEITTEADDLLVRQAAVLSVLSEQLQAEMVRGSPICHKTLGDLRQRTGQRGPAPPSLHEHLASFDTLLGDDDEEDA
jgi:hypothetical protein